MVLTKSSSHLIKLGIYHIRLVAVKSISVVCLNKENSAVMLIMFRVGALNVK